MNVLTLLFIVAALAMLAINIVHARQACFLIRQKFKYNTAPWYHYLDRGSLLIVLVFFFFAWLTTI